MKRTTLFTAIMVSFGMATVAQTNIFPANGNVGIGTLGPAAKISFNNVNDGTDGADGITWFNGAPLNYGIYRTAGPWIAPAYQQLKLQWDTGIILEPGISNQNSYVDIKGGGLRVSSGKVGIGTITPIATLHVSGNIALDAATDINNTYLLFQRSSDGYIGARVGNAYAMNGYQGHLVFETNAGGSVSNLSERMRITADGNVGIGTTTPAEKLSVNGKIRAHEIKVETSNWPDYVFEQDYKMLGLTELESYIKTNKHLPEMPSAASAEKNGIELGEMNKLLLKKVEELTLMLIDMKKESDRKQSETNKKLTELTNKFYAK